MVSLLDEQPCLIEQEHLEGAELLWIADLVRGPVEHIEQQRLQNFGRVAPARKIEGLEFG